MARTSLVNRSLKSVLKTALVETIEENRELVKELFQEALEDVVLKHAIRAGLRTKKVSKHAILSITSGR